MDYCQSGACVNREPKQFCQNNFPVNREPNDHCKDDNCQNAYCSGAYVAQACSFRGCGDCIFFSLNLMTYIAGMLMLIVGLWCIGDGSYVYLFLEKRIFYGVVVFSLVVVGAFLVLFSLLGCLGAVKPNSWLLTIYIIGMFILFAELLVGGGVVMYYHKSMKESVERAMKDKFRNDALKDQWAHLETTHKCCGIRGYKDFEVTSRIRMSCCKYMSNERYLKYRCNGKDHHWENIHSKGCLQVGTDFVSKFGYIYGVFLLVLAFITHILVVIAWVLCVDSCSCTYCKIWG